MRWNEDPLYPNPFSPVHRARKFSAVLGTTSERSSMTIRPTGLPSAVMSINTRGRDIFAAALASSREPAAKYSGVNKRILCFYRFSSTFFRLRKMHRSSSKSPAKKRLFLTKFQWTMTMRETKRQAGGSLEHTENFPKISHAPCLLRRKITTFLSLSLTPFDGPGEIEESREKAPPTSYV